LMESLVIISRNMPLSPRRFNVKVRARVTAVAHFGAFARRALPAALLDRIMVSKLRKKLTANGRDHRHEATAANEVRDNKR